MTRTTRRHDVAKPARRKSSRSRGKSRCYSTAERPRKSKRSRNRRRHFLRRAIVCVLLASLFVAWLLWGPLASKEAKGSYSSALTGVDSDELYNSPYDWNQLQDDENGLLAYVADGKSLSRAGIDVSQHQGTIDWAQVVASGVQFAFVRVGYRSTDQGNISGDSYAEQNLSGASNAGLMVGAYFYSQAINEDEAREEADFTLEAIKGYELAYPIAFDFEPGGTGSDRISSLSSSERTAVAVAFCEEIEEAGYSAMIYGNGNALDGYDLEQLASRGFWYADYGKVPSSSLCFALWQYSNSGSVNGIDGDVDLDIDLTPALEATAD